MNLIGSASVFPFSAVRLPGAARREGAPGGAGDPTPKRGVAWATSGTGNIPMGAAISLCMVPVLAVAVTFILSTVAKRGSDVDGWKLKTPDKVAVDNDHGHSAR